VTIAIPAVVGGVHLGGVTARARLQGQGS
jgi:hypothetical protein